MIARLEIQGLGPHESTDLRFDPKGRSEVAGASEQGKTQLLDAICFAMWGVDRFGKAFDIRGIRDGHKEMSVTVTLRSGASIHRTLKVSPKGGKTVTRRFTDRDGKVYTPTIEKDLLTILVEKRFPDAQLMRLVLVPMAWLPLAQSEGDGRKLRNALSKVLPKAKLGNIVADLMREKGAEWRTRDAITETRAAEQRHTANKARDEAKGAVDSLRRLLDAGEADAVDPVDAAAVKAAHELADLVGAWNDYDHAQGTWEAGDERRTRIALDLQEWEERHAELGEKPDGDVEAIQSAKDAAARGAAAYDAARESVAEFKRQRARENTARIAIKDRDLNDFPSAYSEDLNDARRRLSDALSAIEHGGECPTCHKAGWISGDVMDTAKFEGTAAVAEAEKAIKAQRDALVETQVADLVDVEKRIEELGKQLTEAVAQVTATEKALGTARDELTHTIEVNTGAADWDRAIRALGDGPGEPPEEEEPPAEPDKPRPTEAARTAALALIEQASQMVGRVEQRATDTAKADANFLHAETAHAATVAEAKRLDILVECVRAAPSVAVRRQLDTLGDLGCVSLELPEGGGCLVLVDGRLWHQASTGRQVVADGYFRAGIRRAMKARYLPIFVDQAQDVVGQPVAPIDNPVVLLRTTEGSLEVHDG